MFRSLIRMPITYFHLIIVGTIVLAVACESEERNARGEREWKKTKEGAIYYETCIDGQIFYITGSFYKTRMAGPVRSCEEKN